MIQRLWFSIRRWFFVRKKFRVLSPRYCFIKCFQLTFTPRYTSISVQRESFPVFTTRPGWKLERPALLLNKTSLLFPLFIFMSRASAYLINSIEWKRVSVQFYIKMLYIFVWLYEFMQTIIRILQIQHASQQQDQHYNCLLKHRPIQIITNITSVYIPTT